MKDVGKKIQRGDFLRPPSAVDYTTLGLKKGQKQLFKRGGKLCY